MIHLHMLRSRAVSLASQMGLPLVKYFDRYVGVRHLPVCSVQILVSILRVKPWARNAWHGNPNSWLLLMDTKVC